MKNMPLTCPKQPPPSWAHQPSQLVAITVIILLGLVAGAFILKAPSAPAGETQGRDTAHGHLLKKPKPQRRRTSYAKSGLARAMGFKDHKDEEHHDKPGEHAEGERTLSS